MDESYLTGEPYMMSKTPGSTVLSGAINGESALIITADKLAIDSRYAKIMEVMQASEQHKPRMRRMADQLGAWYTPVAVAIGLLAWLVSGDAIRFLAVMVVATPCPLLIAIPVAIIGSISLAARRAIIVRDPTSLELADTCSTLIFDKTGTLTYGEPQLVDCNNVAPQFDGAEVLALVGSLERFSKHPLAQAIVTAAQEAKAVFYDVSEISELPGQGLLGTVDGRTVKVTSRQKSARRASGGRQPATPSGRRPGMRDLDRWRLCRDLPFSRYAANGWPLVYQPPFAPAQDSTDDAGVRGSRVRSSLSCGAGRH